MLTAAAHIVGAILALFALGALLLFIGVKEGEWNKRRLLQELATRLGVPVQALDEERYADQIVKFTSERTSSELFRNRLSDLLGWVRTLWNLLGALLQVFALGAAVWLSVTENSSNAVVAWFAPGIALVFWIVAVVFSLVCLVLTGRFPGEARAGRKGVAQYLNEAGMSQ